jgi:hypothetical protein
VPHASLAQVPRHSNNSRPTHAVCLHAAPRSTLLPAPYACSVPHASLARVTHHSNDSRPIHAAQPHVDSRHPNITSVEKEEETPR